MRVGIVAAGYGDFWNERHVLVRRLAGAIACAAEVDVLLPGATAANVENDGAVRLLRFPASPPDLARRRAWRMAVLGDRGHEEGLNCTCLTRRHQRARTLPQLAEEELVRAEGGDSPGLYQYLEREAYDVTVLVGYHSPAVCWGGRVLPDDRRVVLVPGMVDESALWLRIHDHTFDRADRILVCTDSEQAAITDRIGAELAARVKNIGFVVGVNSLARTTEPHDFDGRHYLVIARNWSRSGQVDTYLRWAQYLEREVHPDLQLRLVGPGAERLPLGIRLTSSRLDVWRWMYRVICLLDPVPHRLLGREVLEAMLYNTPVVVNARGGATQEHAEKGNGGLWYRTDDELYGVVAALLDSDLHESLGEQARAYVEEKFSDTDGYVKTVAEAVLE